MSANKLPPLPDTSRAAFEAYLTANQGHEPDDFACINGQYISSTIRTDWEIWQASRKAAFAECVAEIRGMKANHKVAQSAINQCAEALEDLK